MTKRQANQIDKQIEAIYSRRCNGIPISVMDIGKVFAAGHAALAEGRDMEAAIVATVETLRQN